MIGVGDVVVLATKLNEQVAPSVTGSRAVPSSRQAYTVQDDGAISVPQVGRVPLVGLSLAEAEAQLFQSLVSARVDPTFSIEIAEFNAAHVALGGALTTPTVLPITLMPLYLDEAITRAGGFAVPDITHASIRIYRGTELYQIPITRYLSDSALQKLRLMAGDSVFIDTTVSLDQAQVYFENQIALGQLRQQSNAQALSSLTAAFDRHRAEMADMRTAFQDRLTLDAVQRDYVYLTGEVGAPGRFALPFGRTATLADALYGNGGFSSQTGNPSQIYVLRGDDTGAITAWQLDARNVANLVLATRMIMQPNDIIFIAEQPVTRWNRVVQQIVPSLITSGAGLAAH